MPPAVWPIELPEGALQIDTEIRGPDGPVPLADAHARILKAHKPPLEPGQAMFSGMLLTTMTVPVLLWMAAATTFFSFLYLLYSGGTTVPN